jgi:hypothetical protein
MNYKMQRVLLNVNRAFLHDNELIRVNESFPWIIVIIFVAHICRENNREFIFLPAPRLQGSILLGRLE